MYWAREIWSKYVDKIEVCSVQKQKHVYIYLQLIPKLYIGCLISTYAFDNYIFKLMQDPSIYISIVNGPVSCSVGN